MEKDINKMTLEELKAEKERIIKLLSVVGTSYHMCRILKINEQIQKLKNGCVNR